jgi:Zn-dependent protease with chaperone function
MSKASDAQPSEFASTHPSHGRRIEDLKTLMPKALSEYEKAKGRP